MRQFGNPDLRRHDYRLRPGAYAIVLRGDRLLLTWQAGIFDEFQLPGGGIDPGETPLRALHREVHEETGWRIARPLRLMAYRRFVWSPDLGQHLEKVCHIYSARPVRRTGPPADSEHRPAWVPLAKVPALLANPTDSQLIKAMLADGLL